MSEELYTKLLSIVSMPHAALWVVQPLPCASAFESGRVSMPHAALWVVQQTDKEMKERKPNCFNAARGFVGGATSVQIIAHGCV